MLGVPGEVRMLERIKDGADAEGRREHPTLPTGHVQDHREDHDGEQRQLDEVHDVHAKSGRGVQVFRHVVDAVEGPQPGDTMVSAVQPVAREVEEEKRHQELLPALSDDRGVNQSEGHVSGKVRR